jgi:hypothetical protein
MKQSYVNLKVNSCSKVDTIVPSFLVLHTTHENHRSNCNGTQEETVTTTDNLLPYEQ